jgi:hypothetical protein
VRRTVLALLVGLSSTWAWAEARTVVVRDGVPPNVTGVAYSGTRDVAIINPYSFANPNQNWGTSPSLNGDAFPESISVLMRFDVSVIQPGTPVTEVTMLMTVAEGSNDMYELHALRSGWSESEATWYERRTGVAWSAPGASAIADVAPEVMATFRPSGVGPVTTGLTTDGVAVVKSWVDNPANNFGFVIRPVNRSSSDGFRVRSADAPTVAERPRLIVKHSAGSATQFQDGLLPTAAYTGAADTFIAFGPPYVSANGGGLQLWGPLSGNRASSLLRFDLANVIPSQSMVSSVELLLATTESHPGGAEVYALERAWDESTASWLSPDGLNTWTAPGAEGVGDRGAAVLGVFPVVANAPITVPLNDAGVAAVQAWVSGTAPNHGFALASTVGQNYFTMDDRESFNISSRPGLRISFEVADAGAGSTSDGGPGDGGTGDAGAGAGAGADGGDRGDAGIVSDAGVGTDGGNGGDAGLEVDGGINTDGGSTTHSEPPRIRAFYTVGCQAYGSEVGGLLLLSLFFWPLCRRPRE